MEEGINHILAIKDGALIAHINMLESSLSSLLFIAEQSKERNEPLNHDLLIAHLENDIARSGELSKRLQATIKTFYDKAM